MVWEITGYSTKRDCRLQTQNEHTYKLCKIWLFPSNLVLFVVGIIAVVTCYCRRNGTSK